MNENIEQKFDGIIKNGFGEYPMLLPQDRDLTEVNSNANNAELMTGAVGVLVKETQDRINHVGIENTKNHWSILNECFIEEVEKELNISIGDQIIISEARFFKDQAGLYMEHDDIYVYGRFEGFELYPLYLNTAKKDSERLELLSSGLYGLYVILEDCLIVDKHDEEEFVPGRIIVSLENGQPDIWRINNHEL